MSAAVHRMHLEIVSGRTLYTECQHKRELFHRSVSSEISQVIVTSVYTSCVRSCWIYGGESWPMKMEHEVKIELK